MPFDAEPASPTIGVLLINLGTPDAAEPRAVKRYLGEFLSDPRVIEIPQLIWQPILRGVILRTRPAKTAHAYAQIWTEHGSPLAANTRAQAEKLATALGGSVLVDYAMRYGAPSIADRLAELKARGCTKILLAPLYPQYSAATTATALDKAFDALKAMRAEPALRTLPAYYDDPAYIAALRASIDAALATLDHEPDAIVASYHGMPERTETLGDPYRVQCVETSRRLSEALGRQVLTAFQSQFGAAKWFGPATDALLADLPGLGARRIAVLTPGFSADCVETLEEINIRGRETFMAAGGEQFAYIPCLNATRVGMDMLETLVRRELAGWLPQTAEIVR
jgi:ferrochelatase